MVVGMYTWDTQPYHFLYYQEAPVQIEWLNSLLKMQLRHQFEDDTMRIDSILQDLVNSLYQGPLHDVVLPIKRIHRSKFRVIESWK